MFFARWNLGGPWNSSGIDGVFRWIKRVWASILEPTSQKKPKADVLKLLRRKLHQTIQNVTHDYENFEFNTIISSLMELMNEMAKAKQEGAWETPEWEEAVENYLLLLAPVAPHVAEELWLLSGREYSIHQQRWPIVDEVAIQVEEIELAVQVNGKLRDRVTVSVDATEAMVKETVLQRETVQKFLDGNAPRKVIYIPGRLVNVVV
jgi:leucyl-tRNA synthetase